MKRLTYLILLATITLMACEDPKYPDLEEGVYAEVITNKGTFVAKLYNDKTPMTVANFVSLAEGTNTMVDSAYAGKPFYNGLIFHRIMKGFMMQGGDPQGTGSGSPGYRFPDEFDPSLRHDRKYLLSMANYGPGGTNGSQFFVTFGPTPWLDDVHSIFGEVVIGQEVIDAIEPVEVASGSNKPLEDVIIKEVNIIRVGNVTVSTMEDALKANESKQAEQQAVFDKMVEETGALLAKQLESAEEFPSGLRFAYITKGTGPEPQLDAKQQVVMEYEGYFTDGRLFDSSNVELTDKYKVTNQQRKTRGQYGPVPIPFSKEAGMIPGFREGMLNMRVGDEVIVYVPYHLGYGEQGDRGIPPATDMIFRLKMNEIIAGE